ncbi:MAG: hypothetical protein ABL871_13695 [Terricaulis sp.]
MLKTVDEACDFIGEWCGESAAHAGTELTVPFAIPNSVARLNSRVGGLWRTAKRTPGPLLAYATPFLGLLAGQDRILDPSAYVIDAYGVVPFVCENQGVWRCGFDPNDTDRLLVSGDWSGGPSVDFSNHWRHVQATTEDALVCALLINMCMQSETHWDQDAAKPGEACIPLWNHPAWNDLYDFWVNEEQTLIYFSGWRVTRRS